MSARRKQEESTTFVIPHTSLVMFHFPLLGRCHCGLMNKWTAQKPFTLKPVCRWRSFCMTFPNWPPNPHSFWAALWSVAPSGVARQNGKGGAQDDSLAENAWGHCPPRTSGNVTSPLGPAPAVGPGALPCSPRCLSHSRHPGSPCGPAFAGRYSACGRCCRRGHY